MTINIKITVDGKTLRFPVEVPDTLDVASTVAIVAARTEYHILLDRLNDVVLEMEREQLAGDQVEFAALAPFILKLKGIKPITGVALIEEQKPSPDDFVVLCQQGVFRFRRETVNGTMWSHYWHHNGKNWVTDHEAPPEEVERMYLHAMPVERAKLYEGDVPFLTTQPAG